MAIKFHPAKRSQTKPKKLYLLVYRSELNPSDCDMENATNIYLDHLPDSDEIAEFLDAGEVYVGAIELQ